jgi:hypothetical protein
MDCPAVYGPYTTVYNGFNRWSHRDLWQAIFEALVQTLPKDTRSIDSTSIKVQRSAAGGIGVQRTGHWPLARWPDGQDPRHYGQSGPAVSLFADSGKCRRHHRGLSAGEAIAVQRLPDRRHGLRRTGTTSATGFFVARPASFPAIRPANIPSRSIWKSTKNAILSSVCSAGSKISAVSPRAMTSWLAILLPPLLWRPSSSGGPIESGASHQGRFAFASRLWMPLRMPPSVATVAHLIRWA